MFDSLQLQKLLNININFKYLENPENSCSLIGCLHLDPAEQNRVRTRGVLVLKHLQLSDFI